MPTIDRSTAMRRYVDTHNDFGTLWSCYMPKSGLTVTLTLIEEENYSYDGDDPDGETQGKLDDGEYVAFESCVKVEWHDPLHRTEVTLSENWLGGSVYETGKTLQFLYDGYFADMLREACRGARLHLQEIKAGLPTLRTA